MLPGREWLPHPIEMRRWRCRDIRKEACDFLFAMAKCRSFVAIWRALRELLYVLDRICNLYRLVQHGRNRAVFFFGEPHRIFNRFVGDVSAYSINQPNLCIDGGWSRGPFSLSPHLDTCERLALLAQNADNIVAGASAQRDQHQLHGTAAGFLVAIDDNAVAAARLPHEALTVRPHCFCFNHCGTPLSSIVGLRLRMNQYPKQ